MKDRASYFSKENKRIRAAKKKLKQILYRIALPNGISIKERLSIDSLIDDIIVSRVETQVQLLEDFQIRMQSVVLETLKEEREETLKLVRLLKAGDFGVFFCL